MANNNEPVGPGSNQTMSIIDALKSGQVNLGGTPETAAPVSEDTTEAEGSQAEFNPSTYLDDLAGDTAVESENKAKQQPSVSDSPEGSTPEESGDIEELVITGPNGRRKVKVDFSDKDKLKKHVQLAYGARKWQKERDDAKTELSSIRTQFTELKSDWDKVEKAYASKGVEGLVDLLEGREGAYSEFRKQELVREKQFQEMDDSERAVYNREQALKVQDAQNKKLREEYEAKLTEISQKTEQAEMRSLESKIHPSFDRYRFKDTLSDPIAETEFDEMLWSRALASLDKIADENIEITSAMVDKEFRRISQAMKKHIATTADSKVKNIVSKKKQDATKKVQAQVSKGIRNSAETEMFRQSMKSGNFVDGLAAFFKAGGKMNK